MRPTLKKVYIVAGLLVAGASAASQETALDRYVSAPDTNYRFELVKTIPGSGYTAFVLDMTSQSWRTPADVDRAVWKHWLTIIRPDAAKGATAFLFITGGLVDRKRPAESDHGSLTYAMKAQSHSAL